MVAINVATILATLVVITATARVYDSLLTLGNELSYLVLGDEQLECVAEVTARLDDFNDI